MKRKEPITAWKGTETGRFQSTLLEAAVNGPEKMLREEYKLDLLLGLSLPRGSWLIWGCGLNLRYSHLNFKKTLHGGIISTNENNSLCGYASRLSGV